MMLLSLKYVYGVVPEVFRSLDLAIESCDAFNIFQVWSESSMGLSSMADVDFLRQKLKIYPDFPLQVTTKI